MPITFSLLGDMGSGSIDQYQVAKSLTNNIKKNNVKFVVGLGDNIYDSGCSSVSDKQFIDKFEKPYSKIPNDIKFYMIIGNHDYGTYWNRYFKPCLKYQIEYGILSQKQGMKWYMPNNYYMINKKNNGCSIDFFYIDTNIDMMNNTLMTKQLKEISIMIRESDSDWKILVGHHTFRSIAGHGNASEKLELYLKKLMKLDIDLYCCGHDHTKQVINYKLNNKNITCIVCGTGGKRYNDHEISLGNVDDDKNTELVWNKETLGFATCFATPLKIKIEFYNEKNRLEYTHIIHKLKQNL